MTNIAFFSSSPHALPLVEKLGRDFAIKLMVTNPDRPIGRKQTLTPSVLKEWAIKNKIKYLTPATLKKESGPILAQLLKSEKIDLIIVIDFGLLIPAYIFNAPPLKTINVHFSLLPKYRGPFPDAFVILNGEAKSGISYVLIDEGFDTGDILAQKEVVVGKEEIAGQLHQRLYQETEKHISYIIHSWVNHHTGTDRDQKLNLVDGFSTFLPPKIQDHVSATYTKLLSREDGFISLSALGKILSRTDPQSDDLPKLITTSYSFNNDKKDYAKIFYNFYRSLSPWPGIWTEITMDNAPKRLKILKVHLEGEKLIIDEVQLEGKNPVSWEVFRKAYEIVI